MTTTKSTKKHEAGFGEAAGLLSESVATRLDDKPIPSECPYCKGAGGICLACKGHGQLPFGGKTDDRCHNILLTESATTTKSTKKHEAGGSPRRVQRRRVRGWKMPANTVCVNRNTRWGNPFKADWPEGGKDPAWAASAFRGYYHDDADYRAAVVRELRGKNLACFCSLDGPCHADVLLEWANAEDISNIL